MHLLIGLFSFDGRLSRGEYWALTSLVWLVCTSLHMALTTWGGEGLPPVVELAPALLLTWGLINLSARRLHDRSLSASCLLIALIPVFGICWLFAQLALYGRRPVSRLALNPRWSWQLRGLR